MPVILDVHRLVQTLGGPAAISRRLEAEGISRRGAPAIAAWARRGNLPCHCLAELMVLSQRLGTSLDIYAYLDVTALADPARGQTTQPRLSPAW